MTDATSLARQAHGSHNWKEVIAALGDDRQSLSPDELLLLADAVYWSGDMAEAIDMFERAVTGLVAEGRRGEAGRVAALLAYLAFRRHSLGVGGGWLAQAAQLLEGEPQGPGHVWVALLRTADILFNRGDVEGSGHLADEAVELARKVGYLSGESLALNFKAASIMHEGHWREALNMLNTATVMAKTGDDLRITSDIYCSTIGSCRALGDYQRAGEWVDEADRWMRANSVAGYLGACQVHRAELKRMRGSWLEAEDDARRACAELERFHLADYLGAAQYEIGEVRRRMGDFAAAEAAFEKAYEHGHDAQPGASLLMADQGDVKGALESLESAYKWREADDSRSIARGPSRARLLPSMVEVALQADEIEKAQGWVEALDQIADAYDSLVWKAAANTCRGGVLARLGDPHAAVEILGEACRMWRESEMPYEYAQTRVMLGSAKRASGDDVGGVRELKAALSTMQELGATTDTERINTLLGNESTAVTDTKRITRTFMFTDIVTSTDLVGLIGDIAWRDLLEWHDRTLRSAIHDSGGEVVNHTGDGYFAAFSDIRAGIDCSVKIQRHLARHRREAGFAPQVRIGLHNAEANRTGTDYSGGGVHLAARIGAHAQGDQILISSATADAVGDIPYPLSPPESVSLKGIDDPVAIQSIDWR